MLKMMCAGPNPLSPGSCRNAEVISRYYWPVGDADQLVDGRVVGRPTMSK